MTIYALAEAELENLQMFANDVTLYSAIATGVGSWGGGVVWERLTTDDQFNGVRTGMIIGSVIVSGVAAYIAWRSNEKRTSALERLKASAQVVEIETAAKQVVKRG